MYDLQNQPFTYFEPLLTLCIGGVISNLRQNLQAIYIPFFRQLTTCLRKRGIYPTSWYNAIMPADYGVSTSMKHADHADLAFKKKRARPRAVPRPKGRVDMKKVL